MTGRDDTPALHWETRAEGLTGWWTIGETGATAWHRTIGNQRFALSPGRGPGSWRSGTDFATRGGWWPAEFRFHPRDGSSLAKARPDIKYEDRGWPLLLIAGAVEPADWKKETLPAGASHFATGGEPARTVALDQANGIAHWWDPAKQSWTSLGIVASPNTGVLLGTPDGVLVVNDQSPFWLLADHSDKPIRVQSSAARGGPASIHRRGNGRPVAIWPAACDEALWHLSLPPRAEQGPERYETFPERLPCPGIPKNVVWGRAIYDRDDHSILPGNTGFVRVRSDAKGALQAEWQAFPKGFEGLPRVRPWRAPDGTVWMIGIRGDSYAAVSDTGKHKTLLALCSILGSHAWRALDRLANGPWGAGAEQTQGNGWFHPVAELCSSKKCVSSSKVLGLLFEDATEQADMLTGASQGDRRFELAMADASGSAPKGLGKIFETADVDSIKVFPLEDRVAIALPGQGQCVTFAVG